MPKTISYATGDHDWPLPSAVASIQRSSSRSSPPAPAKKKKHHWNKLMTLYEDGPDDHKESMQHQPRSAILGLAGPPSSVPAGWSVRQVDATIDSGAEAVVAPLGVIPGAVAPSPMSRSGRQYRAANGSKIQNHGQTAAEFRTSEGHSCGLVFQVADVERVLIGVTPLAEAGHEVRLRKHDGEIVHTASGKRISLTRRGGVYQMAMFFLVKDAPGDPPPAVASGFARPGR